MKKGVPLSTPFLSPLSFTSFTSTPPSLVEGCLPPYSSEQSSGVHRSGRRPHLSDRLRRHWNDRLRLRPRRKDVHHLMARAPHRRNWEPGLRRHRSLDARHRSSERTAHRSLGHRSSGHRDIHRSSPNYAVARQAASYPVADEKIRSRALGSSTPAPHTSWERFDSSSCRCSGQQAPHSEEPDCARAE